MYALTSTTHYTTKMRSFGTEISGNCGKQQELSERARTIIIDRALQGEKHADIATFIGCDRSSITRTLQQWRQHNTTATLQRSGRLKVISPYKERKIYRAVQKLLKITYIKLREEVLLKATSSSPTPTRRRAPSCSTIY